MPILGRTSTLVENASTTSITGTLPSDRQAGDLAVVVFAMPGTPAQFTGPGGSWVQLVTPTEALVAGETIAAYYQFTPGSAPTASTSAAAGRASVVVQSYAGVDTTTPVDVSASTTSTVGTSINAPSVTTVTPGALLLSGCISDTSSRAFSLPGGMTSVKEYAQAGGRALCVAQEFRSSTGATGTRTWAMSPSVSLAMAAFNVALRPAAFTGSIASTSSITGNLVTGMSGSRAETFSAAGALGLGVALGGSRAETFSAAGALDVVSRVFVGVLEIEFTAGVWTDVTSRLAFRVAPLRIRQGRPTPYDEIAGGMLTCALFNEDGALMPDNPGSAYYPNVVPMKRIRWRVTKSSVTYTRFFGFIQVIKPDFPGGSTNDAVVSITAIDVLGLCQQKKLRSNFTETAIWRARLDAVAVDAYEAYGSPAGSLALMTNFSTDAARGTPSAFFNIADATLSFGSDNDVSVGGVATSSGTQTCKTVTYLQSGALQIFMHVKGPSSQVSATTAPGAHCLASLYNTTPAYVGDLGVRQNGASNGLWLRNAAGTELGIVGNLPFGQWVRIVAVSRLANPAQSDWSLIFQDGTSTGLGSVALDIRTINQIRLPSSSLISLTCSFGGIVAIGTRSAIDIEDSFVGGSRALLTRLGHLANTLGTMPRGTIYGPGTLTGNVATGQWTDRPASEVIQEVLRTWGAIAWTWQIGDSMIWAGSDLTYPTTVLATVDTDGDCEGPPRLASGVEVKPTRIEVQWAGGVAVAIDSTAEAAGQQRSKRITTVAVSATDAQARADALMTRAKAQRSTRIEQLTFSLVTAATDHTAEVFNESNWNAGLFPTCRIRTPVPVSHFGVPTLDHHVEGWTETYMPEDVTVTVDTTPAVASTLVSTLTFTAADGSGLPGSWDTFINVNGVGSTAVQSNRARETTAANANAAHYVRSGATWSEGELAATVVPGTASKALILVRSTTASTEANGYRLRLDSVNNQLVLDRNAVTVATVSKTITAGTSYGVRIRTLGAWTNVRVWASAGSEPGTWDIAYVDGTPLTGDRWAIGCLADGTNAVARSADFDDITVTTGS